MNPRKLELPVLVKLLIEEHRKSREKLSEIGELIMRRDINTAERLVNELKTDYE